MLHTESIASSHHPIGNLPRYVEYFTFSMVFRFQKHLSKFSLMPLKCLFDLESIVFLFTPIFKRALHSRRFWISSYHVYRCVIGCLSSVILITPSVFKQEVLISIEFF